MVLELRPMFRILLFIIFFLATMTGPIPVAHAFWIWTPETGKFINPKNAVKDTPPEQLDFAKGFYEAKNYSQAITELRKLIKFYPKSKEAPEAQYYLGRSFEALNNFFEAYKAYQVIVDKYPFSERSAEIVERQYKIGESLLDGKYKGKWAEFFSSDYDVIEVFRQVIKNAPYGKYASVAQYKIGLYLKEKSLLQDARDEFEKTINDYPDSEWAKAAKYQIALVDSKRSSDSQHDQKVTQVARQEFQDFIDNHPDSELSQKAKDQIKDLRNKEAENNFVVAQFYEKQKNYKAAKIYYDLIASDYADTPVVNKALQRSQTLGVIK